MQLSFGQKVLHLHRAMTEARIPHAFGGAIALNYHREPRSTLDIDIDIFLPPEDQRSTLDVLAPLVGPDDLDRVRAEVEQSGQARAMWDTTYVDLFFANTEFHDSMAGRVKAEPFLDDVIRVLSIEDLLVCKALFDRPKDWIDVEAVVATRGSALDRAYIERWLGEFVESDNPRFARLQAIFADL